MIVGQPGGDLAGVELQQSVLERAIATEPRDHGPQQLVDFGRERLGAHFHWRGTTARPSIVQRVPRGQQLVNHPTACPMIDL